MNQKDPMKRNSPLLLFALFYACSAGIPPEEVSLPPVMEDFNTYWYSGKAELATYKLDQVRYGEVHEGEAVLVFVTEDMLLDEQVKFEYGDGEKASVMKLNAIRRFKTGIYDYSIMRSVFTPVSEDKYPHSLKISHSAQDWCGQSFTQLNLRNEEYRFQQFSYFQGEGDREKSLALGLMEDELFSRIRLGDEIPIGKVLMLPSLDHVRMKHIEPKLYEASIQSIEKEGKREITVRFPQISRTLIIKSELEFPHRILSWSETIREGGREMTTRASLKQTRRSAYWGENGNADSQLRKALELEWE